MKELTRTKRLSVITILFIFFLIIGFVTLRKPNYKYQISSMQMVEELFSSTNVVVPDEAMKTLNFKKSGMVMVDLRNPVQFAKGHLGDAVNIPVSDILNKDNMTFFKQMEKESMTVILYGENQRQANGPWILLKQLGLTNIKVLLGGYSCVINAEASLYKKPETPPYLVEEPILDFGKFIAETRDNSGKSTMASSTQKKIVPIKRKKKSVVAGGC